MLRLLVVLADECTLTEAGLMAADEAAKAAVCLTQTGRVEFDLGGRLNEEKEKRKRNDKRQR